MLGKLLLAGSFIAAGLYPASAQTNLPPGAAPGATVAPAISDATHCRDTNGNVRLKVGATGAPSTTGSASNTVPSSSPGQAPASTTCPICLVQIRPQPICPRVDGIAPLLS